MITFDIIIIIVLGIAFVIGYLKGFIKILISLGMFILSIFLSISFSGQVKNLLLKIFSMDEIFAVILAFVIIFVVCSIISTILIRIFNVKRGFSGLLNKLAGGALSILQTTFIISAILIFLNLFNFPSNEMRRTSKLYDPVLNFVPTTFSFVKKVFPKSKEFFDAIEKISDSTKDYFS